MPLIREDPNSGLRHVVYCLLILTSTAAMVGRVVSVKSDKGTTAALCANDRSRWCTVRALVDEGTYVIDNVIFVRHGKRDREWHTIDMVRHRGHDGLEHYYSSKPPLFPTMVAGQYWLVKQLLRVTIADKPLYVMRCILVLTNVVPLAVYFVLLALLVERTGETAWGRLFVMAAATWGTYLTTFSVTLNNHLPAAVSALVAIYVGVPILQGRETRWRYFALAGLAAAFTAANELPASSFLGLVGLGLFWRSPAKTVIAFVPAVLLVAAAFFATTYVAHGSWRPPYLHRGDGSVVATLPETTREDIARGHISPTIKQSLQDAGYDVSQQALLQPSIREGRWVFWDRVYGNRLAIVDERSGLTVRIWDHWYEYEGSYWTPENKKGVDLGEPSRLTYAFHCLLGHHGVFSLTPVWLLSLFGMGLWFQRKETHLRLLAAMVAILAVVCLGFYIMRPLADRNYGGISSGFRWMFWFIPCWLVCLIPAADRLADARLGRIVAYVLLFISVLSASYSNLDPWSHPWILEYWSYLGWILY
ncbi:MAG: hypothetical protein ACC628_00355 [Pirellulaceae bacterium]